MTIEVLFFASLADELGVRRIELELEAPATVGDALDQLEQRFARLSAVRGRFVEAVGMRYVKSDFQLSDGDELAIIPPVSGG